MNRFEGRVALVTGGGRGIGAATARVLARDGAQVLVADVLEREGRQTAESIGAERALFARLDVTREEDWHAVCRTARSRFGGLDILVNNAGIALAASVEDTTLEALHRLLAVNVDGVFLGTRTCAPLLRERGARWAGGAAIVNLSSVAGLVGSPRLPAYSLTKGAVRLFTKSAALDFAQRGYPIRVNSVHPGIIDTDMGHQLVELLIERGGAPDEATARTVLARMHPVNRLGRPEEVANAIAFLCSDDASFMTGSELVVDGGITAQ